MHAARRFGRIQDDQLCYEHAFIGKGVMLPQVCLVFGASRPLLRMATLLAPFPCKGEADMFLHQQHTNRRMSIKQPASLLWVLLSLIPKPSDVALYFTFLSCLILLHLGSAVIEHILITRLSSTALVWPHSHTKIRAEAFGAVQVEPLEVHAYALNPHSLQISR